MKPDALRRLRRSAAAGLGAAMDWLLPRHCLMCGLASGESNLCAPCRDDLPRSGPACRRCALPLEGENEGVCGACLQRAPPWDCALAALDYTFPVDVLVQRFKFNRNMACGEALAGELGQAIGLSLSGSAVPDCIAPVPLHRLRQAVRTFNQSELLARHLGRRLGIPVDHRLLCRVRKTQAQSGLDARSRRRNTRGAFHCRYNRAQGLRHVALVDDVMTTGATVEACARELRRAGIGEISVWVVARAPP